MDAEERQQKILEIVEGARGCNDLHDYLTEKFLIYLDIKIEENHHVEEESALLKSSFEINSLCIKNYEDNAERFEMLQEAMIQAIERYDPEHADSYYEPKFAKAVSDASRSTIKEIKRVYKIM